MVVDKKLTLQTFADLFAARAKLPRRKAEAFVRTLFETVEEGLARDGFAKIKGFGTFKLVAINPRESVNVNTGERIQIPVHTKIAFTPDATLRDLVNRPFADFTTTILAEEIDIETLEQVTNETLGIAEEAAETAEEAPSLVEEVAVPPVAVPSSPTPPPFRPEVFALSEKEEQEPTTPLTASAPALSPTETPPPAPILETSEANSEEEYYEEETPRSAWWLRSLNAAKWWILGAVAILVCSYFVGYQFGRYWAKQDRLAQTAAPQAVKVEKQSPPPPATPAQPSPTSREDTVTAKPKASTPPATKPAPLTYHPDVKYRITGQLGTHTLQAGETLNKIAKRTYGNYEFYRYIIQYNHFDNPDVVPVGTEIKLPKLEAME